MSKTINDFHGENRFLSNFWPAEVVLDGETYPSVEHAYVAAKTLDPVMREVVRTTASPGAVKKMGRVRGFKLRPDWDEVRLSVMGDLVRQKFKRADLRDSLMATGDAELVEGNTWGDTFWGVCRGVGENHLGKILMRVRADAAAEQ